LAFRRSSNAAQALARKCVLSGDFPYKLYRLVLPGSKAQEDFTQGSSHSKRRGGLSMLTVGLTQ
jgi:hypothetical protein